MQIAPQQRYSSIIRIVVTLADFQLQQLADRIWSIAALNEQSVSYTFIKTLRHQYLAKCRKTLVRSV